jgi:hypothetical protein
MQVGEVREFGDGRFIVEGGERAGTVYALNRDVTTLGRADGNDIVLPDVYASREHAEVRWDGMSYVLHDLGSKNGTFLNGNRIVEPTLLSNGDRVFLGDLTLLFNSANETLSHAWPSPIAANNGVRVDRATAEVFVTGRKVAVTAKEFLALALLSEKAGALVTKDELAVHVWPEYQGAVGDANLEQLVSRLRRKLEPDPVNPRYLITVRGLGYRLVNP